MKKLIYLLFVLILPIALSAQVLSQWRGDDRSGVYNETGLLKSWPQEGPALLWETKGLGKGWSSAAVTKDAVYTTGMADSTDYAIAVDHTGKLLWKTAIGRVWYKSFPDSRCTPTIENDRVYVTSGTGTIACINAKDGKVIWSVDAMKKFNGLFGEWGIAESVLLLNDKVFFTTGGNTTTLIAFNKNNGEVVWKSEALNDSVNYVSPLHINYKNKDIIINLLDKYIIGIDASNGNTLWKHNYYDLNADMVKKWGAWAPVYTNTPLFKDGYLFITSGYDFRAAKFKINDDLSGLTQIWTDNVLDTHHGGNVLIDGYIYGSNYTKEGYEGNWCCVDWNTGKLMYEEKWNTKGTIIAADGMLYIIDEMKGNVGLVKANPQKFELVSTFRIKKGTGPYWAHPVIKNGILYLRHGDVLLAYDIKAK